MCPSRQDKSLSLLFRLDYIPHEHSCLHTKPVISIYGDIGGCINPYNPYGKRVEELFIRRINEIIPGFADGNWGEECPEMVETRVPYRDYKKHLEGKPGLLTVEGTYNTRRKSIVVRWDRDAMEYINELRMHSDT